jgi:hypothetical protein
METKKMIILIKEREQEERIESARERDAQMR